MGMKLLESYLSYFVSAATFALTRARGKGEMKDGLFGISCEEVFTTEDPS